MQQEDISTLQDIKNSLEEAEPYVKGHVKVSFEYVKQVDCSQKREYLYIDPEIFDIEDDFMGVANFLCDLDYFDHVQCYMSNCYNAGVFAWKKTEEK